MSQASQNTLDHQPDSPKGKLTVADLSLDEKQLATTGIKNPIQVIKFLNSLEGNALKSEIEKELAIKVEQQKEMQFQQHEKMALLRKVICACLLKQMALHEHQAQAMQQETQLLKEILLDDPNAKTSPEGKLLASAAHRLTPLYSDLDQINKDVEDLDKREEELKKQEEQLNQHLKDVHDPALTNEQMDGMLDKLKKFFEQELAAFQNELNTDLANSNQPAATPLVLQPQPKSQSQSQSLQKEEQQMRASFSQRMLTQINKLTAASQPTPDQATQQHIRQDPELIKKSGLQNIHTQIKEEYDARRTSLSEQKSRLFQRQADLKKQIDLTQTAAIETVDKAQAKKEEPKSAATTPSLMPEHKPEAAKHEEEKPKPTSSPTPTPFGDTPKP